MRARAASAFAIVASAASLSACAPQSGDEAAAGSPRPTRPGSDRPPTLPPRTTGPSIRIVDGVRTVPGELRGVVGLTRPGDWTPSCTATLIGPDVVLSAAHCFCGAAPTNGDGYVGDDATKPGGLYYKIVDVRLAMSCDATLRDGTDLAVARLKVPVTGVAPVRMAPAALPDTATSFRVAGFGAIDEDATVFTWEKREAAVGRISADCSGAGEADRHGCRPGREIVAGQRRSPDTCAGDSGGPLLVASDGSAGAPSARRLMIAGVTSRSVDGAPAECGFGGIYERLTPAARRWIADASAKLRR